MIELKQDLGRTEGTFYFRDQYRAEQNSNFVLFGHQGGTYVGWVINQDLYPSPTNTYVDIVVCSSYDGEEIPADSPFIKAKLRIPIVWDND